ACARGEALDDREAALYERAGPRDRGLTVAEVGGKACSRAMMALAIGDSVRPRRLTMPISENSGSKPWIANAMSDCDAISRCTAACGAASTVSEASAAFLRISTSSH